MGLLDYITSTSLDQDYADASERRRQRGGAATRKPGRWALVVLASFGLLVGTAAVQTARTESVTESSHAALVEQVHAAEADLTEARDTVALVRGEADDAANQARMGASDLRAAEQRLGRLCVYTGSCPVSGPGVRMVVDDNPDPADERETVFDKDLQHIANGLWEAGAEAISINGQRLTALTAIRVAGSSITVNYEPISPPYVIEAIGDGREMPARFVESTTGNFWLNARARFSLVSEMTREESLTVPAAPSARIRLRHAEPLEGGS
jgi:uncharacterized protein YlxW (UPF0749 family)